VSTLAWPLAVTPEGAAHILASAAAESRSDSAASGEAGVVEAWPTAPGLVDPVEDAAAVAGPGAGQAEPVPG
jgi:hypothetical protein